MTQTEARLYLVTAALLWGMGTVAQHGVSEHIGPFTAVGARCGIAALLIFPFAMRQVADSRPLDRHGYALAALVALSFAMAAALEQTGYGMTTVSNGTFLVSTCAVLTPVGLWLALSRRTSIFVWPAAFAVMGGAAMMSGSSANSASAGDAVMLASAACYAAWTIAMGEFVCRFGRSVRIVAVKFALTALICSSLGLWFEAPTTEQLMAAAPLLLFLGCFSNSAAFILQSLALTRLNAAETAIISSGESLFGAMFAAILLGERLTHSGLAGAALLMAGILIVQLPHPTTLRQRLIAWPRHNERGPQKRAISRKLQHQETLP